jgi:two-component system, cell cycle sensor histidine kinase and response regulator CckA
VSGCVDHVGEQLDRGNSRHVVLRGAGQHHSDLYIVIIAGAGWLLSRQAAAVVAATSFAALAVMTVLETWGHLLPRYFPLHPLADLLLFAGAIAMFGIPLLLVLGSMNRTQETLRESEKQARARAAHLQAAIETLAESEEKYRALIETTDTGYHILDTAGRVLDANPAYVHLTGYTELWEILGRSVMEWTAPYDREKKAEALARCIREGYLRNLVVDHVGMNGRVTPVEINAKAIGEGEATRILSLCRDITERRQAEAAVRESEERLRGLFENSTVGMYRTTPDGCILMANPALVALLGYRSFEELASRNLEEEGFEPGYARSSFRQLLESQGAATGIEAVWTRRDGSEVFVRESAKAVRAPDGAVLYYDGIVEDFTQRKLADDALRESEERFRNIADTCPVIIWSGNSNREVTFLNKQAGVFAGRDLQDLLGNGWVDHVHPDDGKALFATMVSTIAARSRVQTELRLRRHDGEYRWMLATAVPRFVGGTYIGHIGIIVDVTELRQNQEQVREQLEALVNERAQQLKDANARLLEEIAERRQTEEMLRESRTKLAAALASMADAVVITDAQGNLIDFNEAVAKFCRFRSKDECPIPLAGFLETFDLFLSDGTPVQDDWALPRALRGETTSNVDYTYRRKDTGESWIGSVSCGPIRGKDGEILGAVLIARDVTEQRQIEERQRHAQKLESIGVLAGGIAHDFNNLLTSILGNASMLKMDAEGVENRRLKAIIESSERAAALTRQLLAYAGKGHFEIADFDLSRLVRSSADLIRVSIPKNIDFRLDLPASLPLVRGDSSQIQQVVMNLAINAAEAIETSEGRVTISARARDLDAAGAARISPEIAAGRYISVRVRDNGSGMDTATKARIFDPFFTTKFTGRGLGLAAVQGILRSHKGAITVESTPGRGSAFTVYLPSSDASGVKASLEDTGKVDVRAGTILVVDDEEPIRAFTQAALEMSGYQVLLAEDGRQASEVLVTGSGADLVLLDVMMPVLGGVETYCELRSKWPEMAFLIVSGYSEDEVHNLGIPADVPFLEKPYTIQMLTEAVDKALHARSTTAG